MRSMKWWTGNYKKSKSSVVLFVLIVLLVITSGCSIFPKEEVEEDIPVIEPPKISKKPEMIVSKGDLELSAKGTGQVFSNTEEYLYFTGSDEKDSNGNANENFRIRRVFVEQGDQVKAGQILAELETRDLDLQIEKSENRLKIEEYRLIQRLREEANTEEEQIEIEQAKAAFRDMQIEHQKLVRQMQNSQIIAPISGQVSTLYYSSGDQVKAYDPVMLIVDTSDLVVGIRITENEQKLLTLGQEVKVEINGVKDPLKGKIAKMPSGKKEEPNRDPWGNVNNKPKDERESLVLISVDQLPSEVKRGTVANGTIVLQRKENVVKIPLAFLHTYGDRNYVVVTDAQGKREVDVELGLRSAREVEIVEGIEAGVTIIGR